MLIHGTVPFNDLMSVNMTMHKTYIVSKWSIITVLLFIVTAAHNNNNNNNNNNSNDDVDDDDDDADDDDDEKNKNKKHDEQHCFKLVTVLMNYLHCRCSCRYSV